MRRHADAWIGLALFASAILVRLLFASRLPFPPLDDPAFYVQTARNLASGRGLVTDVLWSYQFPFPHVTHPSHEYWMPLSTLLMAPAIRLMGNSLFMAQLPGVVSGALLVPLTYLLARRVRPGDRLLGLGAGALLIAPALPVYQSASTDSSAPFALFASLSLISGAAAIERRSARLCLIAGLLSGLAWLARSDGLLVPAILIAMLPWREGRRGAAGQMAGGLLLGLGVVLASWWARNLAAFGVIQPVSPWSAAVLQDYGQLFNWKDPPTLQSLLGRGWGFITDLRLRALLHNIGVGAILSFPYGIYGWWGLFRDRQPTSRLGLWYGAALLLTTAIVFSVPTLAGLFYHSVGAVLPWLAVGSVMVLRSVASRRRALGVGLYAATLGLVLGQSFIAWPGAFDTGRVDEARFAQASAWLRDHAYPGEPVLSTQANSLNYASGFPALTLPNQQGLDSVRDLARTYDARFIVLTQRIGKYPEALEAAEGQGVIRRFDGEGVVIYELTDRP